MAWAKPTTITYWSVSVYRDWDECPKFAQYRHVLKIKEPQDHNPYMERGTAIHLECEDYLKNKTNVITPNMKKFENDFKFFKKYGASAEADRAFRRDWTTTYGTDWDNVWCRVKIDASLEFDDASLKLVDFKTGQMNDVPLQRDLYAVSGFITYPHVTRVDTELWFLDHGKKIEVSYERSEFEKMRKGWEQRVMVMQKDKSFPPKPSRKCGRCYYRKENAHNVDYPEGVKPCKF